MYLLLVPAVSNNQQSTQLANTKVAMIEF